MVQVRVVGERLHVATRRSWPGLTRAEQSFGVGPTPRWPSSTRTSTGPGRSASSATSSGRTTTGPRTWRRSTRPPCSSTRTRTLCGWRISWSSMACSAAVRETLAGRLSTVGGPARHPTRPDGFRHRLRADAGGGRDAVPRRTGASATRLIRRASVRQPPGLPGSRTALPPCGPLRTGHASSPHPAQASGTALDEDWVRSRLVEVVDAGASLSST